MTAPATHRKDALTMALHLIATGVYAWGIYEIVQWFRVADDAEKQIEDAISELKQRLEEIRRTREEAAARQAELGQDGDDEKGHAARDMAGSGLGEGNTERPDDLACMIIALERKDDTVVAARIASIREALALGTLTPSELAEMFTDLQNLQHEVDVDLALWDEIDTLMHEVDVAILDSFDGKSLERAA